MPYQCADQSGGTQPGDSLAEGEEEAVHLEIFEFVQKTLGRGQIVSGTDTTRTRTETEAEAGILELKECKEECQGRRRDTLGFRLGFRLAAEVQGRRDRTLNPKP